MKATIAILAVAASFAAAAEETNEVERAESSAFSIEASVDILSDYIWRGKICNGNPVWQPSVTLGYDAGDFHARVRRRRLRKGVRKRLGQHGLDTPARNNERKPSCVWNPGA